MVKKPLGTLIELTASNCTVSQLIQKTVCSVEVERGGWAVFYDCFEEYVQFMRFKFEYGWAMRLFNKMPEAETRESGVCIPFLCKASGDAVS